MAGRTNGILLTIEDQRNNNNAQGVDGPRYQIICESLAAAEGVLCAHACRNWNSEWGPIPTRKTGGNVAPNRQAINRLYFIGEDGSQDERTMPSGAPFAPAATFTTEVLPTFTEERASATALAAGKPHMVKATAGKGKAGVGSRS